MAHKFQIGDTVQVVESLDDVYYPFDQDFKRGHRGKVVNYDSDNGLHPYEVERKNGRTSNFNVKELKLIKRKGD